MIAFIVNLDMFQLLYQLIGDIIVGIDEEESIELVVGKLLKWTGEKDIHIMTVLHENKSDNN